MLNCFKVFQEIHNFANVLHLKIFFLFLKAFCLFVYIVLILHGQPTVH